ncbi:branched-chain amino acid ABC transporter permease [Cloacibacillus evryensis]|uniref:branched-chain amino acid ABC transporter permease n=1 Tax=Cloacibacillus evryensis TaxID=508460 RepID=UPI002671314C|nr:branched-chain amino acid ABC transporter permease [Cloacibacillus evryensis]
MMMTVFLQQTLNGIILGCIYALIALGLSLIFGILETANFAHGEFYMIGAFIGFFTSSLLGVPFFLSLLIAMVGMGLFSAIIERVAFRPIVGKPLINSMLLSFGLSTALANLALFLFKADPRKIESGLAGIHFDIFGVFLTGERLTILILCIILVTILSWFIQYTKTGKSMRAVAQDRTAAELAGINVRRIYSITFAISGALAAAAGTMVGAMFFVQPDMGLAVTLKSFVIIILGGIGQIKGVIFAAILIGLVESLGGGFVSYAYKDAYPFLLMILLFIIKPEGLAGGNK